MVFFVDVGAYQPTVGSNIFFHYRTHNWRGINIDPNAENIKLFEEEAKGYQFESGYWSK
jgi:hypothetical protein